MPKDIEARRPGEPTRLDPYDILILDAVSTLEQANPAAVGTVLRSLMVDFWSGRVKFYRLGKPDDNHYENSPDDIRLPREEDDDERRLTLNRIYKPFDRSFLLQCLRYLGNRGPYGGFGPEFDVDEREAWQLAASRDPNSYDPSQLYLGFLRIRLSNLLVWASRRRLSVPKPWPTKGGDHDQTSESRTARRGRPSSMNLVGQELRQRQSDGKSWRTKTEAAVELSAWLADSHPEAPPLRPKSIMYKLGKEIPIARYPKIRTN